MYKSEGDIKIAQDGFGLKIVVWQEGMARP